VELDFEKLTVYQKSLQVVTHVIAIDAAAPIGLARLIDQAERATWSMVLNTGEACNEVSRGDRAKFLRYAISVGRPSPSSACTRARTRKTALPPATSAAKWSAC
jgi:hypothetical protein